MEKNEAFRKQVLSHLYGIPDPSEPVKQDSDEGKAEEEKETKPSEKQKEDTSVTDNGVQEKTEKDTSPEKVDTAEESADKDGEGKGTVKADHTNNNEGAVASVAAAVSDPLTSTKSNPTGSSSDSKSDHMSNNSNKSNTTHTTPTTTTSHLYSVLMAPLDGHSPYRDNILRFGADDADSGPRKRMRVDNSSSAEKAKPEPTAESGDVAKSAADSNSSVGMDLTKNQKKKLKKKRRKHLLNKLEVQRAKDFIYSSENEQFSVEKLRTMIEDVTEFLDAIWDVYCSEARLKGESVEEEGSKVAAVLKCLSASGEGSWGDLQLLSRAKSVLVLRSKHLAASTIARVENELGYDTDIRNFIVRMLKFWMGEIVTKG
ncbi:uncharacterized protein LOC143294976 [Babylonia areolata]|uniref:uncharacterized protein LOC143294976 n=1 Tax=Babylonia areolata TaxID=304850 RepID=UPI003FD38481